MVTRRLRWLHVTPDASVLNGGSARERAVSVIAAHQLQRLSTDATVFCSRFILPGAKYLNAEKRSSLVPGISVRLEPLQRTRRATIEPARS